MIDVPVLKAMNLKKTLEDDVREDSSLLNIKKVFANAVKSAIHGDTTSKLSLLLKLPYFITIVGVCEIFMYIFSTKELRDILIYNPNKKCELWRFLTYMTLHNDHIHLSLNIIIQTLVAIPLEYEQNHIRTAAVYFGGGLAGSLGASVFDNESMLVGASGGIYALLISHISHVILNYKTLKYVIYRSLAVSILALADVIFICYHIHVFKNESPRIGLAAHFAGALSGLLLGGVFYKGTTKWKNHIHTISAVVLIVLHIIAIFINLITLPGCSQ